MTRYAWSLPNEPFHRKVIGFWYSLPWSGSSNSGRASVAVWAGGPSITSGIGVGVAVRVGVVVVGDVGVGVGGAVAVGPSVGVTVGLGVGVAVAVGVAVGMAVGVGDSTGAHATRNGNRRAASHL